MVKVCSNCGIEKPLDNFHNRILGKFGRHAVCKPCRSQQSRENYRTNSVLRDKSKISSRKHKANSLGLSTSDLARLYLKQQGRCAICGMSEKDHGRLLAIDHCHSTGAVRGLLCWSCNTGLGNFKDEVGLLYKAISYLSNEKGTDW